MLTDKWGALSAGLSVAALVAVVLALVATHGWIDVIMIAFAVGLLIASYAIRHRARKELIYRHPR